MGSKDPRVDAYIAKSAEFARPILTHLRKQVHRHCPDASETIKWGMPHFDYHGGIFCNMAAFKQHCAFGFWLGDLLKVDTGLDKAMGDFGRITSLEDLPGDKELAKVIKAAMKLHNAGAKIPAREKTAEKKVLVVPPDFMAAVIATILSSCPASRSSAVPKTADQVGAPSSTSGLPAATSKPDVPCHFSGLASAGA